MWIQLNLGYVNYLSIANEKNDNIKNVEKVPIEVEKVPIETEKMPIETEKVPIDNLSTRQRIIFQFVKENGKITSSEVRNTIGSEEETCERYS